MNLLSPLLLIIWVFSTTLFSAIIDARSDPASPISSISEPVFVAERNPTSQFPVKMEAEPPGTSTMQRIFCLSTLFHIMDFFGLFTVCLYMGLHWFKIKTQNCKLD